MKTYTISTLFIFLLLINQTLSQNNDDLYTKIDELLKNRTNPQSIFDKLFPLSNDIDENSEKESRTILKKTVLKNGFLLAEYTEQNWDDSVWVNSRRYAYTYDVNDNLIEELKGVKSERMDFQSWRRSTRPLRSSSGMLLDFGYPSRLFFRISVRSIVS